MNSLSDRRPRPDRGFTIIELLIVVAIIGIIAAIAIPALLNARGRASQKRSMADLRAIGTAIEMYAVDHDFPPKVAEIGSVALVRSFLVPDYSKSLPLRDGWGNDYRWDGTGASYHIGSGGKGGVFSTPLDSGPTNLLRDDMWYSDGHFTAWPEGTQE